MARRRSASRVPFRTLGDLERAAERRAKPDVWGYIAGGAGAERTVAANRAALDRWALVPRVLRRLGAVELATSFLGQEVAAPFFVAPTAYHRQVHPGGERATARAAGRLGILGVYSTLSSDALEAIASAAGAAPRWFQLYLQPEFRASVELLRRAERAGYSAVVVTVDAPVLGSRDRQGRSGFAVARSIRVGNGPAVASPPRSPPWSGGRYALDRAPDESWQTLERLGRATSLPLVVKGILGPEDARQAVRRGARGVLVSNHGGRQLDRAAASLEALPEVVAAVGARAEVYVDGGFRRGSDLLVALALGARGVGLGRPILWALAAGGSAGVDRYLRLLGGELANALLLLGRSSVREVRREDVRPVPGRVPAVARRPPGRA